MTYADDEEIIKMLPYRAYEDLEKELVGENTKNEETKLDNLIEEFLEMEKPTKEIIREFIEKIEIHSGLKLIYIFQL